MMNIPAYIRAATAAAALLLAAMLPAACTATDADDMAAGDTGANESGTLAPHDPTRGIYIGMPQTRAMIEDAPTADKILVRIYRAYKKYETTWHELTPNDMKIVSNYSCDGYPYEKEVDAKPTELATLRMGRYLFKWKDHVIKDGIYLITYNYFSYTALAYRDQDRSLFRITPANDASLTMGNCKLALNGTKIPELYFGYMYKTPLNKDDETSDHQWTVNDIMYYYRRPAEGREDGKTHGPYDINGALLRIVSQVNLHITEVPVRFRNYNVRSLELWGRNIAKQIGLWGHHGTSLHAFDGSTGHYRIRAAYADRAKGELFADSTKLSEISMANNAGGATIKLSSFLLPSEAAQEIWMKVNYDSVNTAGHTVSFAVCYKFKPQQSQLLTGDNALYDVAASGDPRRHDAASLYVYNATTDRYFSYSNVRVNLRGRFQDIVEPPAYTNLAIEVEPGFEQTHSFTPRQ